MPTANDLRKGMAINYNGDVAVELGFHMRRHGAEKEAFETIVASGPRSALPHGRASDRVLQAGDLVTLYRRLAAA